MKFFVSQNHENSTILDKVGKNWLNSSNDNQSVFLGSNCQIHFKTGAPIILSVVKHLKFVQKRVPYDFTILL